MVRGVAKQILLSTMLATAFMASPGLAQVSTVGQIALSAAQSDEYVIDQLVRLYRISPASYAESIAYLEANRPYLVARFNRLTVQGSVPAVDRPATAVRGSAYAGATGASGNGLLLLLGSLGLAAGAAGGGGGGGGGAVPPGGVFETEEYRRNAGLAQINASTRYAAGGRGQGVKIAVLDSGIDINNPEFVGKIDPASTSFFASPSIQDTDGHGTHVAGILAGARNGSGAHGVAYESSLLVFKGIPDGGSTAVPASDPFIGSIPIAVNAGARVMNNSWSYVKNANANWTIADFASRNELVSFLGAGTLAAFESAKVADLLSIFSAGNHSLDTPSVMGAVHVYLPEYAGYVLSVVAVDDFNAIAGFSNRCGNARDFCLAAPGVGIEAARLGGTPGDNIAVLSGTSMAAPHVAGAAALLMSQWPELNAPTVAQILLDSATDLGAAGVDDVYGHGLLNVGAAVRPSGQLMINEGISVTGPSTPMQGSPMRPRLAMAGALSAALSSREMIVTDRYSRGYAMEMDDLIDPRAEGPTASLLVASVNSATGLRGASLSGRDMALGVEQGGFRTWFGEAAAVASSAGIADHSGLLEGGRTGQFAVPLGSGLEARVTATLSDEGAGYGQAMSIGLHGSGPIRASVSVGRLDEQDQVLGGEFQGASGRNASASTRYVALGAGITVGNATDIDLQAMFGETDFTQDGLVAGGRNMASTGGRLMISRAVPGLGDARIGLNIAMPIVVTQGTLTLDAPVRRAAATGGMMSDSVIRTREDVAFESNARPVDVGLSFSLPITETRRVGMQIEGGYRLSSGAESQPFVGLALTRSF